MLQRIYRQRRRVLTCATLFTLANLISVQSATHGFAHMPTWVIPTTFAIFFAIAAVCVAIFVLILPALRSLVEVLAIFTLAEAILIFAAPDLNAALGETALRLSLAAALIGFIHLALYGRLLDRIPALFSFGARSQAVIAARPSQVWNSVVPQHAGKTHQWNDKKYEVLPDPNEKDTVYLRCSVGPDRIESQAVTFVERERPYRCRYYFTGEDTSAPTELSHGIYDFKITPQADKTLLEMSLFRTETRLRDMLQMWFDDQLGAQIDVLTARLEGKRSAPDVWSWVTGRKTA